MYGVPTRSLRVVMANDEWRCEFYRFCDWLPEIDQKSSRASYVKLKITFPEFLLLWRLSFSNKKKKPKKKFEKKKLYSVSQIFQFFCPKFFSRCMRHSFFYIAAAIRNVGAAQEFFSKKNVLKFQRQSATKQIDPSCVWCTDHIHRPRSIGPAFL